MVITLWNIITTLFIPFIFQLPEDRFGLKFSLNDYFCIYFFFIIGYYFLMGSGLGKEGPLCVFRE